VCARVPSCNRPAHPARLSARKSRPEPQQCEGSCVAAARV
jgi:hypothetical protein